jgi:hypothetical protein
LKPEVVRGRKTSIGSISVSLGVIACLIYAGARNLDAIPGLRCPWQALLGIPCPFCGTTTTLRHLLAASPHFAFQVNPLIALLAIAGTLLALNEIAGLAIGRRLTIRMSHVQGWWITGVFLAMIALNWVYVFFRGNVPLP